MSIITSTNKIQQNSFTNPQTAINLTTQDALMRELMKKFEDLSDQMQQILQEVMKIVQSLVGLMNSKTPPSQSQLATIMGALDSLTKEFDRLRDQSTILINQMTDASIKAAGKTPTKDSQAGDRLSNEMADLKKMQSRLSELEDKIHNILATVTNCIQSLIKMLDAKKLENNSEATQLSQLFRQLENNSSDKKTSNS